MVLEQGNEQMNLNSIRDKHGARSKRLRVGRGIGSGVGKTSGRGGKGQTARSGVALNGFEGGQTPLYRRMPKRGFRNTAFQLDFVEVSLARLQKAIDAQKLSADGTITAESLIASGILRRSLDGVRVLGGGAEAFTARIRIEAVGASQSARAAIEKNGGELVLLPLERPGAVAANAARAEKRAKKLAARAKPKGKG
jgi:large subunit ribosomal protein L15